MCGCAIKAFDLITIRWELMVAFRILIVDDHISDEREDIALLPALLRNSGYDVEAVGDGNAAYDLIWEYQPDLVLLDLELGLPDMDGIDLCKAIREEDSNIPIILITAVMTETGDVLRGFEAGADDYVIRPRDMREVVARIKANLPPPVLSINDHIRIDFAARRVWIMSNKDWQERHLQRLQFDLLYVLVINSGLILSNTTIKDRVWNKPVSDAVLQVYVHKLREKIESDPSKPLYIETIRELGYRFNESPSKPNV